MMLFVRKRMAGNLQALRQMRELSVADLASRSGLSVDTLLVLESGSVTVPFTFELLLLLCVVLDVEPNDFFEGLYC
jgi:transcriptional regulator with XRE-family HTH domain